MKYYDKTGRRVPAPPKNDVVPSHKATAFLTLFLVAFMVVVAFLVYRMWPKQQVQETTHELSHKVTHDSMSVSYTYDGTMVRWYVFTDPDTGVQYLFNDLGGVCPRQM